MQLHRFFLAVLCLALGAAGCRAATTNDPASALAGGLLARIHFAGTDRIAADTNAASLNEFGALPETTDLRVEALRKLSVAPYQFLRNRAADTNDFAALIRPLLDDLLRAESYLLIRDSTNEVPELMLAVRLDDAPAAVWQANLSTILTAWTGMPFANISVVGYEGWELRKHHGPTLIRFLRAGGWVLLGWGDGDLQLQPGVLERITNHQPPANASGSAWLDAAVDWPGLTPHHLAPDAVKLPKMRLLVQGRHDETGKAFVRPQLTMQFAKPLGMTLKPWQIPTNTIFNPIVSFTAARGLEALLGDLPLVKILNASPLPEQMFVWAMNGIPFETSVAARVPESTYYLEHLQPRLVTMLNSNLAARPYRFQAMWTNDEVLVTGMPFIQPYLRAIRESAGDFLVGGLLPTAKRRTPLPPELIAEVKSQTNLVYYGWELTETRRQQWRGFTQLYFLLNRGPGIDTNLPSQRWLEAAGPKFGNCATIVTLTAPNELTLLRNSPLGLTGVELTMLSYWLDSPGFPLGINQESPRWRPDLQPVNPPGPLPPGPP